MASPHVNRIKTLYRRCVKEMNHHWSSRHMQNYVQDHIRGNFERMSQVRDRQAIKNAIADCEYMLTEYKSVAPYIHIDDEGGTRFQRNVPFPPEAHLHPLDKKVFI
jgi:hypothetical protein